MAAKIPKNVRFREDQINALLALQTAETDFSALVRVAVDRYLAGRNTSAIRHNEDEPIYRSALDKMTSAAKKATKARKQKQAAQKQSRAA